MPTKLKVTQISPTPANSAYVDSAVADLVDSAPTTLNTLKELSTALGDDPNFATTISTALGNKLNTNITTTGNGNAITAISDSNGNVTATKGSTFSLSTHTHDYLPLSGGTMSGAITLETSNGRIFSLTAPSSNDDGTFQNIDFGWNWTGGYGAGAAFRSIDYGSASEKGGFSIYARNTAVGTYTFIGKTDGSLTWSGSTVGESANTNDARLIINGDHGTGTKGGLLITGNAQNYALQIQNKLVTKGTAPSASAISGIEFYGSALTDYQDRIGNIDCTVTTGNVSTISLRAYATNVARGSSTCEISCNADASGNFYTAAPTPATADNSTKIATTAFVKAQGYTTATGHNHDSTYLKLSGGTVTGTLNVCSATSGSYVEGIRIQKATNNWAVLVLGCNAGTTSGAPSANGGWFFGNNTSNQLVINNVDSGTGNASIWINTDKKVTMNGACNVVGSLTQNGTAVSLNGHTHSYLPLAGGTMTGQLVINKNTDLSGTAANACALVVGGAQTAAHLEFDPNEIQAKATGTTTGALFINTDGGAVYLSNGSAISANNGTFTATKVVGAYYADYAEWFPKGEETEPGDVIVLDLDSDEEKYIKSTKDNKIAVGVHSDNYSHIIGGDPVPENKTDDMDQDTYNKTKYIPVALAGRIDTKFIGKAKKGSYVVASEIAGVARMYDRTKDDPTDIFGILVVSDDKDQEIRRLKVKLK